MKAINLLQYPFQVVDCFHLCEYTWNWIFKGTGRDSRLQLLSAHSSYIFNSPLIASFSWSEMVRVKVHHSDSILTLFVSNFDTEAEGGWLIWMFQDADHPSYFLRVLWFSVQFYSFSDSELTLIFVYFRIPFPQRWPSDHWSSGSHFFRYWWRLPLKSCPLNLYV